MVSGPVEAISLVQQLAELFPVSHRQAFRNTNDFSSLVDEEKRVTWIACVFVFTHLTCGWPRFENVDIFTEGSVGMAMGNYFFTTPEGDEVKVEYSFGYILDEEGNVRINLHHSSMPYAP